MLRFPHGARQLSRLALLALGLAAFACHQPAPVDPGLPQPSPGASAPASLVDASKVSVSAPVNGTIHVSGAPGAVSGGVTTVTVADIHDLLGSYRVLHTGSTYLVALTPAPVASDGSFPDVAVGNADQLVQSRDFVYVYPQLSTTPYGPPAILRVP